MEYKSGSDDYSYGCALLHERKWENREKTKAAVWHNTLLDIFDQI